MLFNETVLRSSHQKCSMEKRKRDSGTEAAVRISTICRSSCPEVLCKKGVLKNFAKFMRK